MDFFLMITGLSALAVVVVQQILKLNVIPVYFANRYPVITNIALSVIASVVVTFSNMVAFTAWYQWVLYVATVVVLAAVTYNSTIKNSEVIQNVSNKKG